jgi:cation diffusion facilitator family transporter
MSESQVHSDIGREAQQQRFAMRLSLWFGLLMLAGKTSAWWFTQSAAILSDAAESVIHVVAVVFAFFALRLVQRPANARFHYGYERISFFSAGFEGAMIILAAAGILAAAVDKWVRGSGIQNLGGGTAFIFAAALINLGLGLFLLREGKRTNSLILEANGKHVLTDSWTGFAVVTGLGLVLLTGWTLLDPLCAVAVAINILWSGGKLTLRAITGLMDYADPAVTRTVNERLVAASQDLGFEYHAVRIRNTGNRIIIDLHLLFPFQTLVGDAHRKATDLEQRLPSALGMPCEVVTHLESLEDHGVVHPAL